MRAKPEWWIPTPDTNPAISSNEKPSMPPRRQQPSRQAAKRGQPEDVEQAEAAQHAQDGALEDQTEDAGPLKKVARTDDGDGDQPAEVGKQVDTDDKNGKAGEERSDNDAEHEGDEEKKQEKEQEQPDSKGDEGSEQKTAQSTADQSKADESGISEGKEERKLDGEDVEKGEDEETTWNTMERGHIYFFYRPKVQSADKVDSGTLDGSSGALASSLSDVQNTHMLLVPRSSDSPTAHASSSSNEDKGTGWRLISLGKKRMPDPEIALEQGQKPGGIGGDSSEALWATVVDVGKERGELQGELGEKRYNTRTQGARVTGAARAAGRGWYILTAKEASTPSSREIHLSYALSHPSSDSFGPVQSSLGLHPSSTVLLQLRNPTLPSTGPGAPPAGLAPDQRTEFDKETMEETFGGEVEEGGTRYARPEQPGLLDRSGVELLVIKKRRQETEGTKGAGEEQSKALENLASKDSQGLSTDQVLSELQLESDKNPPEALEGRWI